jgi:hypothetical protein
MGAQQSQDAADQDGNADVIEYLCCRGNRSEASMQEKDKRIPVSISRSRMQAPSTSFIPLLSLPCKAEQPAE